MPYYKVRMTTEFEVEVYADNEEEAKTAAIEEVEDELCWNDFEPEQIYVGAPGGDWDMAVAKKNNPKSFVVQHLPASCVTEEQAMAEAQSRLAGALGRIIYGECDHSTVQIRRHQRIPGLH